MSVFSIDLSAEQIVERRTREYFGEVVRSFSNECYRSSLVMLWTVIVCDLIYKLQALRDMYGDASAQKLLIDVEAKQSASPNNPEWEIYLLDEVFKRTKMLEATEHVQLQHLQKLRHLCAHPVLTGSDFLFHPTKEITRAQIRMALEALLLKPALFSKKVFDTLVEDISANKAVLISPEKLRTYIEARYLTNMPKAVEHDLFRSLWKLCFRVKNSHTDANRDINTETISVIYSRDRVSIIDLIEGDQVYFSNINPDVDILHALTGFLIENGDVYKVLNPAAQIQISGHINNDINTRVKSLFVSQDLASHIASIFGESGSILGKIEKAVWQNLLFVAENDGLIEQAVAIGIKAYGDSGLFDTADVRFSRFIGPALPKFNVSNMNNLLSAIEANSQTYGRGRASYDHPQIKQVADTLGVDTSVYPKFTKSLQP